MTAFSGLVNRLNVYQFMILFLSILTVVAGFEFGLNAFVQVIVAVLVAVLVEFSVHFFTVKKAKWFVPYSAVITGFLIGLVLSRDSSLVLVALASVLAILSKQVITIEGRHVFNPAVFGILVVSVLFGVFHSWWGSASLPLVVLFGLFVNWRLRRLEFPLVFLLTYVVLGLFVFTEFSFEGVGSLVLNSPVLFFAFFILVEPKTSPFKLLPRVVFGVLTAVSFIALSLLLPKHAIVLALVFADSFVPLLNKFVV